MTKRPTAMERHVLELIEYLKHDEDSQQGFSAAIQSALDHAHSIEERCERLAKENERLYRAVAIPLPSFKSKMQAETEIMTEIRTFQWKLEPFYARYPVPHIRETSDKFWRDLRWRSYRGTLKGIRKLFDENFEQFAKAATK